MSICDQDLYTVDMTEGSDCTMTSVVALTPGDEVPPQLTSGHLVLADIPEEGEPQSDHPLTRIPSGHPTDLDPAVLPHVVIQLPSPDTEAEDPQESSQGPEMRTKSGRTGGLTASPSDPGIYGRYSHNIDRSGSNRHLQLKTKSLGFLDTGLTDSEKLLALRNLHRRSTKPEVFIFPSAPSPADFCEVPTEVDTGHVNTGYKKDRVDANGYHDNRHKSPNGDSSQDKSLLRRDLSTDDEVFLSHQQNHLKYASNGELVHIDYDTLFGQKGNKPTTAATTKETKDTKELKEPKLPKLERSMSLGERALRKVVGGVNRRKGYHLERLRVDGQPPPPKNFFDLALFSCCCCLSPLGLIALILSLKTDVAWRAGEMRKAQRYSNAALLLALLGIGLTIVITILVLVTKFYYWDDVYTDKHKLP